MRRPILRKRWPEDIYINVGSGGHRLPGFLNIDIDRRADVRRDVRRGLPFADGSVTGVFSEHFLEHLSQGDGLFFLRECRRVLKPGGVVRIAMPDLDAIVRRYGQEDWRGDGDMFQMGFEWVQNRCEMLNIAMREWGHQWVYNEEELLRAGRMAGLVPMGRYGWGESDTPKFENLEYRNGSKLIMQFRSRMQGAASERPSVSVLIPAYRATYLDAALASVKAQTYPVSEVVVCDDSQADEVERLVSYFESEGLPCRYFRNDPPRGPILNYQRCLEESKGEFVKYLNDDDVLEPECVERMVAVLAADPRLTLVTSRRIRIDKNSNPLPDRRETRPLVREDAVFEGGRLIQYVAKTRINIIGEPTTVLFRREDVMAIRPHLLAFGGAEFRGMGDVALWGNLLSQGDAAYLRDTLSKFRIHEAQRQRQPDLRRLGWRAWRRFPVHLARLGLMRGSLPPAVLWRSMGGGPWHTVHGSRFKATAYQILNFGRDIRRWVRERVMQTLAKGH